MPDVTVIVPCYNEEESLPHLAPRLDAMIEQGHLNWDVLFVNDGSKDQTADRLADITKQYSWASAVHHPQNKGLGAALRTGFAGARGDVVCTIDSDCTYPPERLPELLAALKGGASIATASPWHPSVQEGDVPWHRKIFSQAASMLYCIVIGKRIYTFTSMFRAYSRPVVDKIKFQSNGFPAVTEILIKGLLAGYLVEEIPIPLGTRVHGQSKMNFQQAIRGHLELLSKCVQWKFSRAN